MDTYVIQVDATGTNAGRLPFDLIAVMGYVTGENGVQWAAHQWDWFPCAGKVHVDQAPGLPLFAKGLADVADVETGAATLEQFLEAALERSAVGRQSTLYQSWGDNGTNLAAARAAVAERHIDGVRYFVANFNWSMQNAINFLNTNGDAVGVQFASPGSNPHTMMPGSSLTLSDANVDLSVKRASWFPATAPAATLWFE